jgi:hypothetical protein
MCYVTSKETEAYLCPNAAYAAVQNEACLACAHLKELVHICAVLRAKLIRTVFHQTADEIRWIVINQALSATRIITRGITRGRQYYVNLKISDMRFTHFNARRSYRETD